MSGNHQWPDVSGRISTTNSSGVYYNYYSDTGGANRLVQQAPGYKARLDVMAASRRKVHVSLNFFATPGPGLTLTAGERQGATDALIDQVD